MKNKTVKALALVLAMSTAMTMGSVGVLAEEAAAEEAAEGEEAAEETAEGEEAAEDAAEESSDGEEAAEGEEAEGEEEYEDTGVPAETPGEVYEPSVDPDAPKDQAILVVSFGTSFNDNRTATIKAVEDALVEAFPDYDVRRAFTAQIIIDKLKDRDNVIIDNMTEALDRAVADGVKTLVVQPTHLMNGLEYNDVMDELANYADAFDKIVVGEPLLTSDEDFSSVAAAITASTSDFDDGETAICFMGHGTEAESNQVYAKMQDVLAEEGYDHYYVGTVEATPTLEDVLASVQEGEYKKVVLEPLMVVAGDHANNDMAGDEEGSWKTTFEGAGYEVECQLVGLGEMEAIQDMYVAHTQAAIDQLSQDAAEDTEADAAEDAEADAAEDTEADAAEDTEDGAEE